MSEQETTGLRYFGPDRHADWCPADQWHTGACLDELLSRVMPSVSDMPDQPAPIGPENTGD